MENMSMWTWAFLIFGHFSRGGFIDEGPVDSRAGANPEHCQITNLQSGTTDTEENFRLGSLNVGSWEVVLEKLFRGRLMHVVYWIWRARWKMGNGSEYNVFWVGNKFGLGPGYWLLGSELIRSLM